MANNAVFNIFDDIYVINMPEHTERLLQAKEELSKIGITDFHVFPGIKINNGVTIQDREAGCKLSHMAIIEKAQQSKLKNVLIFEDDIIFSDKFINAIEQITEFIKNTPFDLFYFGGNTNGKVNEKIKKSIIKVKSFYTTHAYCINHKAYQSILDLKDFTFPYDIILTRIQSKGSSYCLYPRQVFQREGFSYIQDKHRNYDVVLKDKE